MKFIAYHKGLRKRFPVTMIDLKTGEVQVDGSVNVRNCIKCVQKEQGGIYSTCHRPHFSGKDVRIELDLM